MLEKVAAGTHRSMVKMEVAPGFYAMDSRGFVSVVRRTDLWEAPQSGFFASRSANAFGTRPAERTVVRSLAACFAAQMT